MAASLALVIVILLGSCKYGSSRRSARARDSSGGIGSASGFMTGPGASLVRTKSVTPLGLCRRIDQPALKPEPRLLDQNDGLSGVDAGQS